MSSTLSVPVVPEVAQAVGSDSEAGSEAAPDDMTCAICLERTSLVDIALVKGCEHQYCAHCILQWALVKPWCPQCKGPLDYLLTHRQLDGTITDFLAEESVVLLKRARWFEDAMRDGQRARDAEQGARIAGASADVVAAAAAATAGTESGGEGGTDWADLYEHLLDAELEEDEEMESYYFSSAAGRARVVLGNRRLGEGGFMRAGRMYARPVPQRTPNAGGGKSGSSKAQRGSKGGARKGSGAGTSAASCAGGDAVPGSAGAGSSSSSRSAATAAAAAAAPGAVDGTSSGLPAGSSTGPHSGSTCSRSTSSAATQLLRGSVGAAATAGDGGGSSSGAGAAINAQGGGSRTVTAAAGVGALARRLDHEYDGSDADEEDCCADDAFECTFEFDEDDGAWAPRLGGGGSGRGNNNTNRAGSGRCGGGHNSAASGGGGGSGGSGGSGGNNSGGRSRARPDRPAGMTKPLRQLPKNCSAAAATLSVPLSAPFGRSPSGSSGFLVGSCSSSGGAAPLGSTPGSGRRARRNARRAAADAAAGASDGGWE